MAGQGLTSLGGSPGEAGLREILLVFEELGRASCPAPLLGAVAANLALATQPSNTARALIEDLRQGRAMIAVALGGFDGDAGPARRDARRHAVGHGLLRRRRETATHLLVFTNAPAGVALVASGAPGLKVQATPGLAVPPFCELSFANTPAVRFDVPLEAWPTSR